MRAHLFAATAIVALMSGHAVAEEQEYTATLVGHAILPGGDLHQAAGRRARNRWPRRRSTSPPTGIAPTRVGSMPGMDGVRPTGLSMPFDGQAVQGFSGIKTVGGRHLLVAVRQRLRLQAQLGRRRPDAAPPGDRLGSRQGRPDRDDLPHRSRQEGAVPDRQRGHQGRYLTGADFDIEVDPAGRRRLLDRRGVRAVSASKSTRRARCVTVVDTAIDGKPVKSPDHPTADPPGQSDAADAGLQPQALRRL